MNKVFISVIFLLILCYNLTEANNESQQPHIIFILADDLGFNDCSFRGSSQIMTPNIDSLAFSGVILNKYYVNPICTPSRSALMTGKYPIHTGMQHTVLFGQEPRGLPLTEKLLPQYLSELGYQNHIVGKWHLGHYKKEYTPLHRGFLSHTGFWTGHQDLFDHTASESGTWGLDMRRGMDVAYDLHGKYSTDVIHDESIHIINQHNISKPLFLYVAHAAVHSSNPYHPLPAPDSVIERMSHIKNFSRQQFAAMLTKLDESVGALVAALQAKNMLHNSIIVFSTDNGGPAEGFNLNAASNWPLRGVKNTLWEGGVRGAGLVWSPFIQKPKRLAEQMFQVSDWLPTLYTAAGGNSSRLPHNLDGIDLWHELSNDEPSKRKEILHNIDDIYGSSAVTVGDYKVVKGTNYNGDWDSWYGPAGNRSSSSYDISMLYKSPTGQSLVQLGMFPAINSIRKMRAAADIDCTRIPAMEITNIKCNPLSHPCLFNIREDPCENFNLADKYPEILKALLTTLNNYNATAVPPSNLPLDKHGDPKCHNYVWTNFGDYDNSHCE